MAPTAPITDVDAARPPLRGTWALRASASRPQGGMGLGAAGSLAGVPAEPVVDAAQWASLLGGPLSPSELVALRACATERRVLAGELVLRRDDAPARAAWWVAEGELALGQQVPPAGFVVERTVRGPAWLDLSSIWLSVAPAFDAKAMGAVRVVALDEARLRAALQHLPSLAERLLASLSGELRGLAVNTQALMHQDAQARLAAWLVAQPAAEPVSGTRLLQLHQRKRDIASQLAVTPETLSRLMRAFTRRGLISVQGYSVLLHDVAGLERLAVVARALGPVTRSGD